MEFEKMTNDQLINIVGDLDNICMQLHKYEIYNASEDVNEVGAEIRCILEERGIEV